MILKVDLSLEAEAVVQIDGIPGMVPIFANNSRYISLIEWVWKLMYTVIFAPHHTQTLISFQRMHICMSVC